MHDSSLPPASSADPKPEDLVIAAVSQILRPLIGLLLANDIKYGSLVELIKRLMVDGARERVPGAGGERAVSRVSVATGIHRKEVKRLLESPGAEAPLAGRSLAAEAFTRWMTDARFQDGQGRPAQLPRYAGGAEPESFETLARSVSRDVHPRTLLEELLRLKIVSLVHDRVVLTAEAFVPSAEQGQILRFLADNLHDHVAAAVTNVEGGADRFLEQALFADALHPDSVLQIERLARQHWQTLLRELTPQLQALVDQDRGTPESADARVRIGMYSFSAPLNAAIGAPAAGYVSPPQSLRREKS
ncbi:MAG TPA: DUF6502 family protein [Burkholderiaceae bacterium]|nr:DUF6502 family protein [Burkholderiaceae bacterium]